MEFFIMARNLLLSYRHFSVDPLPFAIICDKQNKYTQSFDDVILLPTAKRSYIDKLELTSLAPYDRTIFIDADCLAYRDLNDMWEVFKDAPPFCVLGDKLTFDQSYGWFLKEDVGEFSDKISFNIIFHGGAYYIEPSHPGLVPFRDTVSYIHEHYFDYKFHLFPKPSDEAVFSLALAVHGFAPAARFQDWFCYLPIAVGVKAAPRKGLLNYSYRTKGGNLITIGSGYLLHWGHNGGLSLFTFQTYLILRLVRNDCRAFFNAMNLWLTIVSYKLSRLVKGWMPYSLKQTLFKYYEYFNKLRR